MINYSVGNEKNRALGGRFSMSDLSILPVQWMINDFTVETFFFNIAASFPYPYKELCHVRQKGRKLIRKVENSISLTTISFESEKFNGKCRRRYRADKTHYRVTSSWL